MCEANAYLIKDDQTDLIMESVDIIKPLGNDRWQLVSIFGNQKNIKGRIRKMNLVNHKIFFEFITE